MDNIKLISWNVNGLRAIMKKGFLDFFSDANADFLCLQETRLGDQPVKIETPGYQQYWNHAVKKGYSGTAIFTRVKPSNVFYGIGIEEHDQEGRVITLEYNKFYLVTVYTPNSGDKLKRLSYRTQNWDVDFLAYVKKLEHSKPVVFCGDLNVAHQPIDLARPKGNERSAGFTQEERQSFDAIVAANFIDSFRHLHKDEVAYSWWSYRTRARERNIGWRIDYVCLSQNLLEHLQEAKILGQVMGSDHCPVAAYFSKGLIEGEAFV